MPDHSHQIVQKLWNYCNVLPDDGMSYLLARGAQASGDYPSAESIMIAAEGSEQLMYLLFLFTCASFAGRKMADERTFGQLGVGLWQ